VLVDDEVLRTLEGTVELAPLHNPTSLAVARTLRDAGLRVVACFDTAFHATLPAAAATYALPRAWNRAWRLRRYGFHGLSYEYVAARAAEQLGRPLAELRLVLCHLGGGASACAVVGGRSVDTTMGFTPMEGLAMQVRSGSVDPGLLLWLLQTGRVGLDELADALEHRSGLAGLSGTSGDIREVLAGLDAGDQDCRLAFDVYVHRLAAAVGAMAASAGGLDALVFTGGVGEHVARGRAVLAERLAHLGPVPVLVIATGEDLAIAAHVERLL
jgi:acetate kinase